MQCQQAQELVTARLDNELDADEQRALDAHLRTCGHCQRALAAESRLKQQIQMARQDVTVPAALRQQVEGAIAGRGAVNEEKSASGFAAWFGFASWRPALVALLLAIGAGAFYYTKPAQPDLAIATIGSHRDLLSGKTALVRYGDAVQLRQELSRAVGGRFAPVAFDLSMMKLQPVSGFVQKIAGRDVLVTVYQGDGPAITCFTFLGSESDAPGSAERFFDTDMKMNFYSFTQDGINAVMHREDNIVCILVSKMAPADLLALLRGKSAHA